MKTSIDNLQAQLVGDVWYVQQSNSHFWGKGKTLESAVADLSKRSDDYHVFTEESRLPAFDMRELDVKGRRMFQNVWRNIRILGFVALCCIPISYAISSGLTRVLHSADLRGEGKILAAVENKILAMGANQNELSPEKAQALHQAISNIVARVRPYTSQFGTLLAPPQNEVSGDLAPTEKQIQK